MKFLTPVRIAGNGTIEDIFQREDNVRRLKAANYGKWYIKPEDYNRKIVKLNKRLNVYFKKGEGSPR